MKTLSALFSAVVVGFLCLAVSADDKKPGVKADDEKFIKKIAESGKTEVKLSELAAQKATRADVKEFAQMLVTEHTAINDSLVALATNKHVEISAIIEPAGAAKFKEFEKLSGKAFDDEFLAYMASSHRRSVTAFEDAAKDVSDPEVKTFVNQTLPILRAHLDKAMKLRPPTQDVPAPLPPM
jgi:putative membrane protein